MHTAHSLIIELFMSTNAFLNWLRLHDADDSSHLPWGPQPSRSLETAPSPLYYASLTGLAETARLFVERKAEINVQKGQYGNPLQAASWKDHVQIVQILVENGADINKQSGLYYNALLAV